jgi:aminoglycoside 3-N-acetyltransferase
MTLTNMGGELKSFRSVLERHSVPRTGVLVVHSAIGSLSRQGFRAEEIIESLLEHLSGGDLFMPTMSWRTIRPSNPNWDEMATPSHTGVLSEIFRTRYSVARSLHPTHSVAGLGPNAVRLLSRHHIGSTPVSANSPYGLMRDYATYILLVGVGLESCTAIHLPEETTNPELYLLPEHAAELYRCRDRHGIVHNVETRRHRRLNRDFPKFARRLVDKRQLETGNIAGCPYTLVFLSDLLREVYAALAADPRATLSNDHS